MKKNMALAAGTALCACLALASAPRPAAAGPCAEQIDQVARMISGGSGKETGTMAGAAAGTIENKAPQPGPSAEGAGKGMGTLAGPAPTGGGRNVAEPAPQVAKSPQDVRLQSQGMPTTAQGGDPRVLDENARKAMASLERARSLDQKNDQGCMAAVQEAQNLMRAGR